MAVKPIVTFPNKILTEKTKKIDAINAEVIELIADLKDTLNNAQKPEGAGIAANQIGSDKRVCIVRNFTYNKRLPKAYSTEDFILINPKINFKSKEMDTDWEGCLSIPDKYGMVPRHQKIKVEAETIDGNKIEITATDLFARVIQHEVDHLDGVLFTSKVTGKIITEDELDKMYV